MHSLPRRLTEHGVRRVLTQYDGRAFAEAAAEGVTLRRGKPSFRWLRGLVTYRAPARASARLRRHVEVVELALVVQRALMLLRQKLATPADGVDDETDR